MVIPTEARVWSVWRIPGATFPPSWHWQAPASVRAALRTAGVLCTGALVQAQGALPMDAIELDDDAVAGVDAARTRLRAAMERAGVPNDGDLGDPRFIPAHVRAARWVATRGTGGRTRVLGEFNTRAEAASEARASRDDAYLDAVEEIRAARGGTLSWGVPVVELPD